MTDTTRFCRGVPGRQQCDTCTGRLQPGEQLAARHSRHEPWPFEPCPHYVAPVDTTRCGGFVAEAHHVLCDRRFDCARFLDRDQTRDFRISACEGEDRFVLHVETFAETANADHPVVLSSVGVLDAAAVRTICAAGGA